MKIQINHVIHTPFGQRILAEKITKPGNCWGVLSSSMDQGMYPPLHNICYSRESTVEDIPQVIDVRPDRNQRTPNA